MFRALFSRLTGRSSPAPDPELDAQFAIAALLVRLAKSDAHYAVEEIAEIDRILARTWDLNPVAAMKLRAQAERIEAEAPETAAFTEQVQAHTPYQDRAQLFDAMWDVSLADRRFLDTESRFLDQIATALGITPDDIEAAARRHGDVTPTQPADKALDRPPDTAR